HAFSFRRHCGIGTLEATFSDDILVIMVSQSAAVVFGLYVMTIGGHMLDLDPKLTITPEGLHIHLPFMEQPIPGILWDWKKEVFYPWENLYRAELMFSNNSSIVLTASKHPKSKEMPAPKVKDGDLFSLRFSVSRLKHGRKLPDLLNLLIDAADRDGRSAIICELSGKPGWH
ncbi:MAG: hypothetical protein Q3966_07995, partial [Neisseria sp.]|nr:hypothetical protein [Neisseria sp.]